MSGAMIVVKPAGKLAVERAGEGVYERRSVNDLAARRLWEAAKPVNPRELEYPKAWTSQGRVRIEV